MTKITLDDLVSLTNQTSAVNTINDNNSAIEVALENTLSRDGTSPNEMEADLDMNNNRILNLPEPLADTEPVRKGEFDEAINALGGGILTSADITDFDEAVEDKIDAVLIAGTNVTLTYDDGSGTLTIDAAAGSIPDGDKGDITVSASGTSWTVDNDAITYAKIQNVSATDRLLGRSTAGAGDIEEITCTSFARTLLDDASASDVRTTLSVESTTQLNTRDTNNRARANHTGTQLASTISDFNTAADARISAAIGSTVQGYDADLATIGGLADPNADRILFWDDSAGAYAYLTAGTGLTIAGTTITSSGGTYVESSGIALDSSTDSSDSFAHGLGVVPKKFGVWLRNVTAEHGYSTGDRLLLPQYRSATFLYSIIADATNITLSKDAADNSISYVAPKTGGTGTLLTVANWEFIFWAEA